MRIRVRNEYSSIYYGSGTRRVLEGGIPVAYGTYGAVLYTVLEYYLSRAANCKLKRSTAARTTVLVLTVPVFNYVPFCCNQFAPRGSRRSNVHS